MNPRQEAARLAEYLTSSDLRTVPPRELLLRLARQEELADQELATVQDWALNEFSMGLNDQSEPDKLAQEADRLVGLVEQLKTTWK